MTTTQLNQKLQLNYQLTPTPAEEQQQRHREFREEEVRFSFIYSTIFQFVIQICLTQ